MLNLSASMDSMKPLSRKSHPPVVCSRQWLNAEVHHIFLSEGDRLQATLRSSVPNVTRPSDPEDEFQFIDLRLNGLMLITTEYVPTRLLEVLNFPYVTPISSICLGRLCRISLSRTNSTVHVYPNNFGTLCARKVLFYVFLRFGKDGK